MSSAGPLAPTCYRHSDRVAGAVCRRCGRPICPECMREAPVGWQCQSCVHEDSKKAPVTQWRPSRSGVLGNTRVTPVVIAVIVVNVVIFGISSARPNVLNRFGMVPYYVQHGQTYRLVTAAFLHVNITHILFNMLTLAIFGSPVEVILGKVRFVILYLLAALGGSVCSYLLSPYLTDGVGASGAIFGLMGAYFVLARRNRLDTSAVLGIIIINLVIGFVDTGIDWRAHIGGLVVGAAVAFGFSRAAEVRSASRRPVEVLTAVVVVIALAGLLQLPPGHVNL